MSPAAPPQELSPEPSSDSVLPLPELPEDQRGTSTAAAKHYKAEVSNAAGYLCHIHLDVNFDAPPEVMYQVFVHPDNAGVFRDIKRVGYRHVVGQGPGWKQVEVEQIGELKVLWVRRQFSTYLTVTEDSTDPACLRTSFELLKSDVLSRFHGAWQLRPLLDPVSGAVVGTAGTLDQDILPRGVPSFFRRLPLLGGLLRKVSLGTIQRLVEDITHLVDMHRSTGLPMDEVMRQVALSRGHTPHQEEDFKEEGPLGGGGEPSNGGAQVASFALDNWHPSEGSEEEEEEHRAAAAAMTQGQEGQQQVKETMGQAAKVEEVEVQGAGGQIQASAAVASSPVPGGSSGAAAAAAQ